MNTALHLRGISKRFGRRRALDGLDLRIPEAGTVGLVGENGAGKTTAFGVALSFIRPDAGSVDLFGNGPFDPRRDRGRVGILPQDAAVPPDGLPLPWLTHLGALQGLRVREAARQAQGLLEELHLADRAHAPMRTLSHGMRKRIMLAQALIGEPDLVLLDEPFSGIDPREAEALHGLLVRRLRGKTLLISSHDLGRIEPLCDCVVFMHAGRVVRSVEMKTLASAHRGRIAYRLTRAPDLAALRARRPDADLRWEPRSDSLICRLPGSDADLAEVNRTILAQLLDQGAGILSVEPGNRIEAAFFEADRQALTPPPSGPMIAP